MKVPEKVPAAVSTRLMTSSESRGFFQIDHSGRPSARAAVVRPRASRRQQTNRFMDHHSEKSISLASLSAFLGHDPSQPKKGAEPVDVNAIKNNVKACMFDQYGTVVDMQGGLVAIATPFLQTKRWGGDPNAFVTWWRRTHFENSMIDALLHREHTPYREIGHRAVAHVMDRAGIKHTQDEVRYLVGEIEKLKPFPEVPAALAKLQTKYRLVVLSNGDPDLL